MLLLLASMAFGQTAADFNGAVSTMLVPSDLVWGLQTTVGSPAVFRHNPSGNTQFTFIFYETKVGAETAQCPGGLWGIGTAYVNGNGSGFNDLGPIVQPTGTGYHGCVAAHPTAVALDSDTWVVYFKAEQACAVGTPCDRYTGLGRVVFEYSGLSGGTHQYVYYPADVNPVMSGVAQDMGYPKVAFVNGQYRMAFGQNPDIFVASSSFTTSFTVPTTPVISAGDPTGWGDDELFTPAVLCESNAGMSIYPGGRSWVASYAAVTDQSLGKFTTTNYTTATEQNVGAPLLSTTDGDAVIRHADMVTHLRGGTRQYGLYFSSPDVAGNNSIYRVSTASFQQRRMDDKRCP